VVVHIYNPSTLEVEAGRSWVWGQAGLQSETLQTNPLSQQITSAGKDVEKKEFLYCWWHYGKQYGVSSKTKHRTTSLCTYPKEMNPHTHFLFPQDWQ
jgi:hypothetical protein